MAVALSTLIFSPLSASPNSGATVTDTHISVRVTAAVVPELPSRTDPTVGAGTLRKTTSASESEVVSADVRGVRCKSARRGLEFYRGRQRDWLRLRWRTHNSLAFMSLGRAPRSCADARFLAQVAKARSFAARQAYGRWLERRRNRIPVGEAELRAYINDDCLEEIIDRESAGTWSPTVRNYTDGIAYGLPQARPGYKMASAGSDWETNPKTQIAWMRGYVNGRYGGSCGALSHHNANGWY